MICVPCIAQIEGGWARLPVRQSLYPPLPPKLCGVKDAPCCPKWAREAEGPCKHPEGDEDEVFFIMSPRGFANSKKNMMRVSVTVHVVLHDFS